MSTNTVSTHRIAALMPSRGLRISNWKPCFTQVQPRAASSLRISILVSYSQTGWPVAITCQSSCGRYRSKADVISTGADQVTPSSSLRMWKARMYSTQYSRCTVPSQAAIATADNPRVRAVLESHWRSERTQAAIQRAAQPLEPTIERIGALLFGTPQGGVTPEFARVLRNQILFKDRRWLMLAAQDAETSGRNMEGASQLVLRVTRGRDDAPNPFVN